MVGRGKRQAETGRKMKKTEAGAAEGPSESAAEGGDATQKIPQEEVESDGEYPASQKELWGEDANWTTDEEVDEDPDEPAPKVKDVKSTPTKESFKTPRRPKPASAGPLDIVGDILSENSDLTLLRLFAKQWVMPMEAWKCGESLIQWPWVTLSRLCQTSKYVSSSLKKETKKALWEPVSTRFRGFGHFDFYQEGVHEFSFLIPETSTSDLEMYSCNRKSKCWLPSFPIFLGSFLTRKTVLCEGLHSIHHLCHVLKSKRNSNEEGITDFLESRLRFCRDNSIGELHYAVGVSSVELGERLKASKLEKKLFQEKEDPMSELAAFLDANKISKESWGFNSDVQSKVQNSKTVQARRSVISVQLPLSDKGDWAVQVLSGYDGLMDQVTLRLILAKDWTVSRRNLKDELGNKVITMWPRKVELDWSNKRILSEALSGDGAIPNIDPTNSRSWPTTGVFLDMGVLMELFSKRDAIIELIKATSQRMTLILQENPSLKEAMKKEANARTSSYHRYPDIDN